MTSTLSAQGAKRLTHAFWIGLYLLLDMSWIWHDQLAYRFSPFSYDAVLRDQGCAPEQYRMAAILTAQFLATHLHFHSVIAGCVAMDLVGAFILSGLLYWLTQKELGDAPVALQVCTKALVGLGMLFYLHWNYDGPRVETLPNCIYVMVGILLIRAFEERSYPWLSALGFVLISWAEGWIRADVSVIVAASLCLAVLFPVAGASRRSRLTLFLTGSAGAILSGFSLLYLMKVIYPAAHYCCGVISLRYNFGEGYAYIPFLTFMPPVLWGLVALGRSFSRLTVAHRTILIASVLYILMWSTVGSWSEARIGVPFAMVILPFTCVSVSSFLLKNTEAAAL
jgi:hypothetical protein